jgi:hypothetical protein
MFNCSFQIIYKGNRQEFLDLLLNGTPTKTYSLQPVNSSIGLGRKCQFRSAVQLRFPDIKKTWNLLKGGHRSYPVVELAMPNGTFFVHRNGYNIGRSNYAILDPSKQFHFTVNIKEALDMVELLGCDRNDLPLLMGRISDRLLPEFERRLKGEIYAQKS